MTRADINAAWERAQEMESDFKAVVVVAPELHEHTLPSIDHPPVTWRYKDGCTVTKHADGSATMSPRVMLSAEEWDDYRKLVAELMEAVDILTGWSATSSHQDPIVQAVYDALDRVRDVG